MRSLLADIRSAALSAPAHNNRALQVLRDDVLSNLRQICATPRGSVPLAQDYGVVDATRVFHEYPGSIPEMVQDLELTFSRYEPRLHNVSVTHVPSDELELVLRFNVEGTLVVDGRPVPVSFASVLHAEHHFDLR